MREQRSGSQILFGYLPNQTVDLQGRVWKVKEWATPEARNVDHATVRQELLRTIGRWASTGRDSGLVEELRRNGEIDVVTLNYSSGVRVEPFPKLFVCKNPHCRRVVESEDGTMPCSCGSRSLGQLHFVGYHECGHIAEPWIPKCPTHKEARIVFPGTASAAEIKIVCPVCNVVLRTGLGMWKCRHCDDDRTKFRHTVHRAAAVYTPRGIVVVNPPTSDQLKELSDAGGVARALKWVVDGMRTRSFKDVGQTRETLRRQLLALGSLSAETVDAMVEQAAARGEVEEDLRPIDLGGIPTERVERIEQTAVTLATAVMHDRLRIENLVARTSPDSGLGRLYREDYPAALRETGLQEVELIDRFPVLTGYFGFTRGNPTPGESQLIPFRNKRNHLRVHSEITETEALLVRLDPVKVAGWIEGQRGHAIDSWTDAFSARQSLVRAGVFPAPGSDPPPQRTVGSDLLTLTHSYCHRMIRRAAVFAGIDRNALSELVVPEHLCFFVYASSKGDFVLGGLQALFETELNRLLEDVVYAESRCALDPGCAKSGSACAACVHLGEPSCRWFNRFLDRSVLFGPDGYFGSLS